MSSAVPYPMDFSAWIEVYLGGQGHTFDARRNAPRIGRVVMARGRDAGDVPITMTFGQNVLTWFNVATYEVLLGTDEVDVSEIRGLP